jgi:hypothetical protein
MASVIGAVSAAPDSIVLVGAAANKYIFVLFNK